MENQNFVNYYIDTLISTMTDAIVRNVSLQANAKIANENIEEKTKRIAELETAEVHKFQELEKQIGEYKTTIASLVAMKNEFESTRHQLTHLETFKTELIKSQKVQTEKDLTIANLENKIRELELSILKSNSKKKKITDKKIVLEVVKPDIKIETKVEPKATKQVLSLSDLVKKDKKKPEVTVTKNTDIEDGGNF